MLNDLGCKQKLSMSYSYVTRCALSSFNKIHFMYFEDQLILHHLAITVKLWYNTIIYVNARMSAVRSVVQHTHDALSHFN